MNPMHPFRRVDATAAQLAELRTRLHDEQHIDIEAHVDSEHRVCVRPCCDLTTRERVAVIVAVRACTSAPLRWSEVA